MRGPAACLLLCVLARSGAVAASPYDYVGPLVSTLYEPGYDVAPEDACEDGGKDVRLLVVVHSQWSRREARDAVRLTWGTIGAAHNVCVVFLMGRARDDLAVPEDVQSEASLYGDVVVSRNIDSFDNLTLKTVAMLEWASQRCAGARYVLRIDDDVFLNVPRLLWLLEQDKVNMYSRSMLGNMLKNKSPARNVDNKFYVPEAVFESDRYPPYLQGGLILFTGDLLHDLFPKTLATSFFRMQDVFLSAFVASKMQARVVEMHDFIVDMWWKGRKWDDRAYICDLKNKVAVHPATYETMFDMWFMACKKNVQC